MSTNSTRPNLVSSKRPEKKFGPVAVWLNETQTAAGARLFRSVTVSPRRYFDRDANQWKDAPNYRPSDLPGLVFSIFKALDYCFGTPIPGQDQDADDAETPF